jgi:uncharacterized membrane protein
MSMEPDRLSASPTSAKRRWRPLRPLISRPRFSVAMMVSIVVSGALLWAKMSITTSLLLGFDVGALVFLGGMLWLFNTATLDRIRHQARIQDAGRWGILWSAVGITAVVMVALGTELHAGGKGAGILSIVIAGSSIVLSWLFMNVMFALHYAHGFYGDYGKQPQGLDFPGRQAPDYWDFAYFSIIIGMTFQVSDVQVTSRYLRRIVLLHSVIAFFFNMFIIAVTVNILAGQA